METGSASIGRLSTAQADGLIIHGPFSDATAYFTAIAEAKLCNAYKKSPSKEKDTFIKLGAFVFLDMVRNTELFTSLDSEGPFHFNHMDMGTQSILDDDYFNFLASLTGNLLKRLLGR